MKLLRFLLVALVFSPAMGLFTQVSCWAGNCVQQNREGTWCYIPRAGQTSLLDCKGSQADLQAVMDAHLQQNVASIVYYRGADNTPLDGGAAWPVPADPGVIRLCLSGIGGDGIYQTTCTNVGADNVIYGSPYCQVATAPHDVADGCYTKKPTSTFAPPLPTSSPVSTLIATPPMVTTLSDETTQSTTETPSSSSLPSSSSSSASTSTPTSTPAPPPRSNDHDSTVVRDIIVPIIVAILGLLAAIFGGGWWRRQRRAKRENMNE